jgi:hypothetical protein
MSWKILKNIDEHYVRADITYYAGLAEDEDGNLIAYYYKKHDYLTLYKDLKSFMSALLHGYNGVNVVTFEKDSEMDEFIENGGLAQDKTPSCDWCEAHLQDLPNEERYQQWYYANNRQEGKLCYDCHIKEICHTRDEY